MSVGAWSVCRWGRSVLPRRAACCPTGSGWRSSRQALRRIVDSTLGNPLFVLEGGRALLEQQGVPGFGEDIPVPDAVEDMLGIRVAGLAPALRQAAARRRVACRSNASTS